MSSELIGKVAIVTGGAAGFGKSLVELMVKKGMKVIIGDVDVINGKKLEQELNKNGIQVKFVTCDVTKDSDLINLFDTANSQFNGAQVMVNNAGIGLNENFETSIDAIDSTIDINVKAVLKGTSLAIQHFKNQSHSDYCIINTSSYSGILPLTPCPIYSVSKSSVIYMTQTLKYLKKQNIRVNAVAPAFSPTNFLTKNEPDQTMVKVIKMAGLVPIEKVVNAMFNFIEDKSLAGEIRVVANHRDELLPKIDKSKL